MQIGVEPKAILGGAVMQEVIRDLQRTRHHSCIASVPTTVGSKAIGSLSADHSRTLHCVNLVVSIIRLFGSPGHRLQSHATNYMHLVTAVQAADADAQSATTIDLYERHAHQYLQGLLELHPYHRLTPSQHLLIHMGRFLRTMGPNRAHRTWAFERFIFQLKQHQTNRKAGKSGPYFTTAHF